MKKKKKVILVYGGEKREFNRLKSSRQLLLQRPKLEDWGKMTRVRGKEEQRHRGILT